MHDHDKAHAAICGHLAKEFFQRFQSPGRCSQTNDRKTSFVNSPRCGELFRTRGFRRFFRVVFFPAVFYVGVFFVDDFALSVLVDAPSPVVRLADFFTAFFLTGCFLREPVAGLLACFFFPAVKVGTPSESETCPGLLLSAGIRDVSPVPEAPNLFAVEPSVLACWEDGRTVGRCAVEICYQR
jgi:hypothetical protein